jgi:hypothetical protein
MSKRNWNKGPDRANKMATHNLRGFRGSSYGPAKKPEPKNQEITIVVGENSPTNTTGQREVHSFPNLAAAHKAGFTWAI